MKTNILNKIIGLGLMLITALSSASCGKEVPMEEKETRIDVITGIIEVDTYYKDGTKVRDIVQGEKEVRFKTIEVDSVVSVSLQRGTSARVNGWIIDSMKEMESFVYYPGTDELKFWKEVK